MAARAPRSTVRAITVNAPHMTATQSPSLPAGGEGYDPEELYDEGFAEAGRPREHYAPILERLAGADLRSAVADVRRRVRAAGCTFGGSGEPFGVDLVPRVFTPEEWDVLAAGLEQRVRALDAFLHDVYGEQRCVADGVIPARVVEGADHYEPALRDLPAPRIRAGIAGLDVIRTAGGELQVLEDNLRTPSGLAYAMAAREAVLPWAGGGGAEPVPFAEAAIEAVGRVLAGAHDGPAVLLTDGAGNTAFWEHAVLAERLGIPLVTLAGLDPDRVGVVYRRTDEDRLLDERGRTTSVGRALLGGLRTGRLACVNALGNGVADDKLVHAYVEDMVRYHLREEPLIRSVPTYDLGDPVRREEVLDRLGEMVVKPRSAYGGRGVFVGPVATPGQRDRVAAQILAAPAGHVAQETVWFSTHPTVVDGELVPRHVDLRAFVTFDGERAEAIPGGLTRVAYDEGELVVNSSRGGGGKDTWVLRRPAGAAGDAA
jgi:carboxylate-amine ligase